MILTAALFIVGIALLVYCSDKIVEAAVRIATHLRISEFIIGLTAVAFGTSLPEFVTSVMATATGHTSIALGNAIGSNLVNIGLVLGMSAVAGAMKLHRNKLHLFQAGILVLLSTILAILLVDGVLSRFDAGILMLCLLLYLVILAKMSHSKQIHARKSVAAQGNAKIWLHFLVILASAGGLWLGAKWVVDGVISFSVLFGVGEGIVALTAVAIGTSLPEMTVAIQAMRKHHPELSIGDVLGANAMNIMLVLGFSSLVAPLAINISMFILVIVMGFFALLLWSFLRIGENINRFEGLILVCSYIITIIIIGWRF